MGRPSSSRSILLSGGSANAHDPGQRQRAAVNPPGMHVHARQRYRVIRRRDHPNGAPPGPHPTGFHPSPSPESTRRAGSGQRLRAPAGAPLRSRTRQTDRLAASARATSRKCTCESVRPGRTTLPSTSRRSRAAARRGKACRPYRQGPAHGRHDRRAPQPRVELDRAYRCGCWSQSNQHSFHSSLNVRPGVRRHRHGLPINSISGSCPVHSAKAVAPCCTNMPRPLLQRQPDAAAWPISRVSRGL